MTWKSKKSSRENSKIVLIAVDRLPKLCYDIAIMDPTKHKATPAPPPQIQGQPGGVVRERESLASFEKPLDPEVAKIVKVLDDHTNQPPINIPQPQVSVEIKEPQTIVQSGSPMSKSDAKTIIKKYSPDNPKRGKAVIIVRESDIRDLKSKNAF